MRRATRAFSALLIAIGALLVIDAVATLVWQEPISAIYANLEQRELEGKLKKQELQGPTPAELEALVRLKTDGKRIAFLARSQRRKLTEGEPIGRIKIPELGTSFVRWREQVLLARAVPLAARRMPIAAIAAELGYASPSAFAAMVRRSVGVSPRAFLRPTS